MSKNILLAVDAASHDPARHVRAAADMTRDLSRDSGDHVVVLHVAQAILHAAQDHDARLVVLGSSSRTDLPLIPLGSVAGRLLHMATRPVLIVPRTDAHAEPAESPAVAASAGAD